MSSTNDNYELLCNPTDDDITLNREKILIPYKSKNKLKSLNVSSYNSGFTNRIIKYILIIIGSIIGITLIFIKLIQYLNSKNVNVRK